MREDLEGVTQLWLKQVELCRKTKKAQFGDTADRLWGFLGKDFRATDIEQEGQGTEMPDNLGGRVRTRLNKAREFISLMLPYVHERLPHFSAEPRMRHLPADLQALAPNSGPKPEQQLASWLQEFWINYLLAENDLYGESRRAIPEGLVKGRGVVWHAMSEGTAGQIPVVEYDSVDNLLIDADCTQYREAGFIIRECWTPTWRMEDMFGVPAKEIRAAFTSHHAQAQAGPNESPARVLREEQDICHWFQVWSRIGIGYRLRGAPEEKSPLGEAIDSLGRHVWLAIVPGMRYPLNLRPDLLETGEHTIEKIKSEISWPIAFFEDRSNPWPTSFMDIYPNGDNPWATSPLESSMPHLIFLDRLQAYIEARMRITARDIMLVSDSVQSDLDKALLEGGDYTRVLYKGVPEELKHLMHIVQFPELNKDVWQIKADVERRLEEASGMGALMYGRAPEKEPRSAYESKARETHLTSRPSDYADGVVNWMANIGAKAAQASRMYVRPATVAPLFNEPPPPDSLYDGGEPAPEDIEAAIIQSPLSMAWGSLVNTEDPRTAAAEYLYTCEPGTGVRRNKQKQMQDAQMLAQTFLPVYTQWASPGPEGQPGMVGPYNALMEIMSDAFDMPLQRLMLPGPPTAGQPGQGQPQQGQPPQGGE